MDDMPMVKLADTDKLKGRQVEARDRGDASFSKMVRDLLGKIPQTREEELKSKVMLFKALPSPSSIT